MAYKKVYDVFIGLGLSETDAEVYILLAKKGPQFVRELSEALDIERHKLHLSLKNLQQKNLVKVTQKKSPLFYAVSFDKAIDLLAKSRTEEAKRLQAYKKSL